MMDSAAQDLLLQKLEELIIDEEKIVTLLSASDLLNIKIHDAKKVLQVFVDDQKQVGKNVAVTYVVTGVLKNGELVVKLVREDDLPGIEQLFKEISSKVIYSVQKSEMIDTNIVASVNGFDSTAVRETPLSGCLKSKNCIKRVAKPVKVLPKPESKPVIKGKSSFFIKSASTESAEVKPRIAETKNEGKALPKSKSVGGIANFFNKMPSKPITQQKSDWSNSQVSVDVKEENETTGSEKETDLNQAESMEVESCKDIENEQPKLRETAKTPSQPPNKNKRQRSASKQNDKSTKRRKRIKEIAKSDSDSDDMFADNSDRENEDTNKSEDEELVVKPQVKAPPPVKNKRRKLVDKTYEDDEGFIITSKEWVYESASEDEKEQDVPLLETTEEKKPNKVKKEISAPLENGSKGKKGKKNGANTNQPTLMNFFKKV